MSHASHTYAYYGEECECTGCFGKPWHMGADYPCGLQPKGWQYDEDGHIFPVWFNDDWED